jgi:hypothetical protein
MAFRGGQLLFQLAPLEDANKDEAKGRHVKVDGPDGQSLLLEQVGLVAAEAIRPELMESAASVIALAGAERV